eukprot:CAMPEP_0194130898 /NCGR_PEP_ID=MMETSP0152-20130528/1802_1 /TAXON_ID=1049557 /ORGANISM="Thalassiothrix antarctica, Strain L6-D1" /LENGTH=149 /DNA_ID=CAMNT_0038825525 /DNA_START=39 /DNA_END=488 /DNA_ORIENTATION=+
MSNSSNSDHDHDQKQSDLPSFNSADLSSIFPDGKVKSQLFLNKDVGRMQRESVQLIECATALFIQKLVQTDDDVVTLNDIKEAAESFDFVNLEKVKEKRIVSRSVNKRGRTTSDDLSTKYAVKKAAKVAAEGHYRTEKVKVIEDKNDYD